MAHVNAQFESNARDLLVDGFPRARVHLVEFVLFELIASRATLVRVRVGAARTRTAHLHVSGHGPRAAEVTVAGARRRRRVCLNVMVHDMLHGLSD